MKEFVPLHFSEFLKKIFRSTTQIGAIVMLLLVFLSSKALAEGSIDFRDYPGYRLFYWANELQQIKVYANAGEFINVGASHVGLNGGAVVLFKPDGTLANVFNDAGPNAGLGIINNDDEEFHGPTGGGTTNGAGYVPGIYQVQPGEEGIWSVIISFPAPSTETPFTDLLNSDSWKRSSHQLDKWCVLAWDVTVSTSGAGNDGGALLEGRVFTNEYKSIIDQSGNTTSPSFYVLSKDGYQYQVDVNNADPKGFDFFVNSSGVVNYLQQPAYKSVATTDYIKSSAPQSWTPNKNYLYDPQKPDFESIVTHKIFFNAPSATMPSSAPTFNVFSGETYTTWLFTEPSNNSLSVTDFTFIALDDFGGNNCFANNMTPGFGGDISFSSNIGGTGQLSLDLNSDGDFEDDVDRIIYGDVSVGENTIYWDGLDGLGDEVEQSTNFTINYKIEMKGGEIHVMALDVENNDGGISLSRLNGSNSPDNNFFYDHSSVDGAASGGAPSPSPTTVPYAYDSNWGDEKLLDYWAYTNLDGDATGSFIVDVVSSCTTPSIRDSDGDGQLDDTDLDDDNDGIPDVSEFCFPSTDWSCFANGIDPSRDEDDDDIPNYLDANDPAFVNGCTDITGNGICDIIDPAYDKDLDGVPDHLDLDADNDGILDVIEAGHGQIDADHDGRIDGVSADFGENGLFNAIATHPDLLEAGITYPISDTDNNSVADYDDIDADGDGLFDAIEASTNDADYDGIVGIGVPFVDRNGIVTMDGNGGPITLVYEPRDLDEDMLPDYKDWDRDNDGIADSYECPDQQNCSDSDNDNIPDVDETDSDGDGILDSVECPDGIPCADTNNNNVDDYKESICGTGNIPAISGLVGEGNYCAGNTVLLSASNSINMPGVMIDYTWTGPNGFIFNGTANANGPFSTTITNITSSATGTYQLTLLTDQGCGSPAESVEVTVGTSSVATPTMAASDEVLCEGQQLQLSTDQATGTTVSYEWFFDNGSSVFTLGSTSTPLYVNNNANTASSGNYFVEVTSDGCTSSPSNPINITVFSTSTPIAVNSTSQADPICAGEVVQLSVPLVQDATYEWFGPNGFTSTVHDPVINNITSTDAGNYYAVVNMSDGCANLVSTNTTVYVQENPVAATIETNGAVCEGSEMTLTANSVGIPSGTTVSYEWFYVPTGNAVEVTTVPELTIPNIPTSAAGEYYVVMTVGNCVAPASEMVKIEVIPTSEMPNAGMDMSECGVGGLVLNATMPTMATGTWSSPTGAVIPDANNPQAEVFGLTSGENILIWSLSNGVCENYASDEVVINYSLVTDVAAAGDDIKVCESTTATLNALAPSSAFGVWSYPAGQTGISISNPTSTTPTVSGLVPGNTYTFTYTLSEGTCLNYDSDEVEILVSEIPDVAAHIIEDEIYTCGDDEVTLNAIAPSVGEGKWTTSSNATIVSSNNASTIVADIPMGGTMFVWTLSNGGCENYDSDEVMVYREEAIELADDSYTVDLNEKIEGGDLLVNDYLENINDWNINIIDQPTLGTIEMTDGVFNYTPNNNAFGTDEIVYEICNVNCADDCQQATVTIVLSGLSTAGDCWIPNVLTPNDNGKNDVLQVSCVEQYPDNELVVFNRFGNKVFSTSNYQNDWRATYKGKNLPAGTYYYILKLSKDGTVDPVQGFFEVLR